MTDTRRKRCGMLQSNFFNNFYIMMNPVRGAMIRARGFLTIPAGTLSAGSRPPPLRRGKLCFQDFVLAQSPTLRRCRLGGVKVMRRLRKSPLKKAISKYRRARTAHRADAHDARLTLFAKIFSAKIFLRGAVVFPFITSGEVKLRRGGSRWEPPRICVYAHRSMFYTCI